MLSEGMRKDRSKTKRHYDRLSSIYDQLEGGFEKKHRDTGLRLLDIERGERVLEIGFGTGEALRYMAGCEGKIIGIDISTGMASVSKEKLEKEGLFQKVSLVCGDAVKMPFRDDSFQKVFASFTLELFDDVDIIKLMDEIKRVMDERGTLVVVSLSKKDDVFVKVYQAFHQILPNLIDCRPIPVERIVRNSGFEVEKCVKDRMAMIPVEIVVAKR